MLHFAAIHLVWFHAVLVNGTKILVGRRPHFTLVRLCKSAINPRFFRPALPSASHLTEPVTSCLVVTIEINEIIHYSVTKNDSAASPARPKLKNKLRPLTLQEAYSSLLSVYSRITLSLLLAERKQALLTARRERAGSAKSVVCAAFRPSSLSGAARRASRGSGQTSRQR